MLCPKEGSPEKGIGRILDPILKDLKRKAEIVSPYKTCSKSEVPPSSCLEEEETNTLNSSGIKEIKGIRS